jgi:hypothetical protein
MIKDASNLQFLTCWTSKEFPTSNFNQGVQIGSMGTQSRVGSRAPNILKEKTIKLNFQPVQY